MGCAQGKTAVSVKQDEETKLAAPVAEAAPTEKQPASGESHQGARPETIDIDTLIAEWAKSGKHVMLS